MDVALGQFKKIALINYSAFINRGAGRAEKQGEEAYKFLINLLNEEQSSQEVINALGKKVAKYQEKEDSHHEYLMYLENFISNLDFLIRCERYKPSVTQNTFESFWSEYQQKQLPSADSLKAVAKAAWDARVSSDLNDAEYEQNSSVRQSMIRIYTDLCDNMQAFINDEKKDQYSRDLLRIIGREILQYTANKLKSQSDSDKNQVPEGLRVKLRNLAKQVNKIAN